MRAAFALVAFGALAACEPIHGLSGEPEPVLIIRGHLSSLTPASRPRAGLVWLRAPPFIPYCYTFGPTFLDPDRELDLIAAAGCRDPFDAIAWSAGPSVALEPDSLDFELPIYQLPTAEVLVGTPTSRVGYAALVVYSDRNNDQELDLVTGCRGRRSQDTVYATSFQTLTQTHIRVTYSEGEFDTQSFFYPHPGCAELPPPGFSIWQVGGLAEPNPADSCRVFAPGEVINLQVQPLDALLRVTCLQSDRQSFSRPPADRPARRYTGICTQEGDLATADVTCPCPDFRLYSLKGCSDSINCPKPEWDLTAEPPDWWPCGAEGQ